MNLFRSEEHVKNWDSYDPNSNLLTIQEIIVIESSRLARERLSPTYLADLKQILQEAARVS